MKLYADPITVNCRKVVAGLDLIGAEYELVHVDYFTSQQRSPEYTALNPNASLPTLVDGEFVLWEFKCDPAICRRQARRGHLLSN